MAPAVAEVVEESIIERLVAADKVRWWKKPNLRRLYLLLVPFCLFIESTSGFDRYVTFRTFILPSFWLTLFFLVQ